MTALAKAQGVIADIPRDRTVTVQPRSGTAYHFRYSTFGAVINGIKKSLSENGIAYTQVLTFETNDRLYYLTTSLHFKNQFISSVTPLIIGGEAGNQQFGSALTYMKRYALAALVGVAADEDDDGNAADGNEVQAMQQAVNRAPKVPAPDPISSGPAKGVVTSKEVTANDLPFNAAKIDVSLLPDGNSPDWMTWGRAYIEKARTAPNVEALDDLHEANAVPLKNMEISAPKMYTNLSMSLIKVRGTLERKNAGQ